MAAIVEHEHFDLQRISPRVWAAIGRNGASNAGFIATKNGVILIDALASAVASVGLRSAIEAETGTAVTLIILTHHHADHWAGLSAWEGSRVVGHPRMVDLLTAIAAEHGLENGTALPFPALLRLWVGEDAARILGVESQNGVVTRLRQLAAREAPRFWLPTAIAPETIGAQDEGLSVTTRDLGPGHGTDDLVVEVRDGEISIWFTGDQAFFGRVPVVGGPHLDEWIELARGLASDSTRIFVPGHGKPGSGRSFLPQIDYLVALQNGKPGLPSEWGDERSRDWHQINQQLVRTYSRRGRG